MSIILFLILIFLILFFVYKFCTNRSERYPPGPIRLPIWGSYWFMLKENFKYAHYSLISLAKKYKTDILGLYLGPFPVVVTFGQKLCKEMLTRDEFNGRADTVITRLRAFEKRLGIFFVDGWYWKEQRRFSLRNLRDFGFGRRFEATESLMMEEIEKSLDLLHNGPKQNDFDISSKKGNVLMPDFFFGPFANAMLWMLCSSRFEHHTLRELTHHFIGFQRSIDATGCAISFIPWLKYVAPGFFGYTDCAAHCKYATDFMKKLVDERKKTYSSELCRDFIDVYLKQLEEESQTCEPGYETSFSEEQLLMTLVDYTLPSPTGLGHTLSFLFAYLLHNPEVQNKIHREIDDVVGRGRMPCLDDRQHMPYTEASIRESLRINPIVPLGVPRVCEKDCEFGGYFIPKNTFLIPNIESAHMDESVWKEPHKFSPERWLLPNGALSKQDYSIGFGAGKRLCAGETFSRHNMFLMTAALLQNFSFEAVGELPDLKKVIPGFVISLEEYWIRAVPR